MKPKIPLSVILTSLYLLVVVLFLADGLTAFEIKSQLVKYIVYLGFVVLTLVIMAFNLVYQKNGAKKVALLILPLLMLIGIIWAGPMAFVFAASSWSTQTVLYQNQHLSFKKVEFQMQDKGALGYNRRIVEVTYLTDWFMIVTPPDEKLDERSDWIKVDQNVNELGLKFP